MKKIISLIFILSIIVSVMYPSQSFAGNYRDRFYIEYDGEIYKYKSRLVSLEIDGNIVETGDMPAIILDSRTLVPAREVFESEAINANVEWNGDKKEVYISNEDQFIVLKIDSNTAYVNNQSVELEVPPKLIRDVEKEYAKTMIPLRFVTENLGYNVDWDQDTYTAKIMSTSNETLEGSTEEITEETTEEAEEIANQEINTEDGLSEKLEEIGSMKANRELPTALKDNAISWEESINNSDEVEYTTEISEEDYPNAEVSKIEYVEENGTSKFIIYANSPISSLDHFVWDGKYIIDIHGANYDLDDEYSTYKLTYEDNAIVTSVRSSQQDEDSDGKNVLRVVFDLKNPNSEFNLSLSKDREEIVLEMNTQKLYELELGQNAIGDYIRLTGTAAPKVEAFRLSNPDRLVFDLLHTVSVLGHQEAEKTEGQYVTSIRTAQFDSNTARVVVETDGQADFDVIYEDEKTTLIQLHEPSYSNIKYENYDKPVITLEQSVESIDLSQIQYENRYMQREFIITLPGNYQDLFGQGGLQVNDGYIDAIDITKDEEDNTQLEIKAKEVYEFRIEEENENIVIKAYKPKELYSKIIIVDSGHGGKDPGATANGAQEKDINLSIVHYLKEMLDQNDAIKVYYTRLDDTFISLQERTDLANEVEADFFLSVHNNAFRSEHNGTETIYFKDSDHSGLNSSELAEIYQDYLVDYVGLNNRGIKSNNTLFVLRHTEMPAVIVEGGFLTNKIDITYITDPAVQQIMAQALYDATLEVFKQYPTGR